MIRRSVVEQGPPFRAPQGPSLRATPFHAGGTGEPSRLLSSRQRQQLLSLATKIAVPSRRLLYREGSVASSLYFCSEGMVKTFRTLPSGKKRVTAFLLGGDIFGLAENGRYVNTAQAVAASTLYRLPLQELTTLLQQDADLQFHFLLKVTHELREAQHRMILMGRRDAPGRLAMFLVMLRSHVPPDQQEVVPLPMSRSDIAGYIGHSLEAVSRASSQLAKQGVIAFQGRHAVRILNPKRLEKIAADL